MTADHVQVLQWLHAVARGVLYLATDTDDGPLQRDTERVLHEIAAVLEEPAAPTTSAIDCRDLLRRLYDATWAVAATADQDVDWAHLQTVMGEVEDALGLVDENGHPTDRHPSQHVEPFSVKLMLDQQIGMLEDLQAKLYAAEAQVSRLRTALTEIAPDLPVLSP